MNEVAKVYADALFSLALEENKTTEIREELSQVVAVFSEHHELRILLQLPSVSFSEKSDMIKKIFDGAGVVLNLILLLTQKNRLEQLEEIADVYNSLHDDLEGIASMTVTTAIALKEQQKIELIQMLEKRYHKKVRLTEKIDPEIIGGVIVDYGNIRMDNSVRSRLKNVQQTLLSDFS